MGECHISFWDEPWLGRDNMVNQGHGPGPGFQGITDLASWLFSIGTTWPLVGFPNRKSMQGESFLKFLRFLGIITLLDNMRRYLKVQWFSLWCKTKIPLFPWSTRSLLYQSLDMLSLVKYDPTTSLNTYYNLVRSWDGISFLVRRYYTASRLFLTQNPNLTGVSPCHPRGPPWCYPPGCQIRVYLPPFGTKWYLRGICDPWNPPSWVGKAMMSHQAWVMRLFPWWFSSCRSGFQGGIYGGG